MLLLAASPVTAELSGKVSWIYDGDTLLIEDIGKVRLIGIDSPESKDSERDKYYLNSYATSRRTLRLIARRAKQFNISQVKGKRVRLEFDQQRTDRYGRLLAYLYLPDGRLLNKLLLDKGLAYVFRRFDFKLKDEFLDAETLARSNRLGLWK